MIIAIQSILIPILTLLLDVTDVRNIFKQNPSNHLKGHDGCPDCQSMGHKRTTEQFIKTALEFNQGLSYNYDQVEYIDSHTDIIIIGCYECGDFFVQSPANHLKGQNGCPGCQPIGHRRTTEQFVKIAQKLNKNKPFDYSRVEYIDSTTEIIIGCCICREWFFQTPRGHLTGRIGCRCSLSKRYSRIAIEWLEYIAAINNIVIRHATNGGEAKIGSYFIDGWCESTSTVYEFHGDYWHGNPEIYKQDDINPTNGKTYGELYQKTMSKDQFIIDSGYKLVVMWERDWTLSKKNHINGPCLKIKQEISNASL